MIEVDDATCVLGFIEWAAAQSLDRRRIVSMDERDLFELIDRYLVECLGYASKRQRQSIVWFLYEGSLSRSLRWHDFKRYEGKIWKCFFLPIAASETMARLVKSYWEDLDELTRDYLDIYYGPGELKASGYKLRQALPCFDIREDALPCIVLWQSHANKAVTIDLIDLDASDVFRVISSVVQSIKVGCPDEDVFQKADETARMRREMKRPMKKIEIKQKINGAAGVAGYVEGNFNLKNPTVAYDYDRLAEEVVRLRDLLKDEAGELNSLNASQRTFISKVVGETVDAKDDAQRELTKGKLRSFLMGLGKGAAQVIAVLQRFKEITKFFGLEQGI